MKEYITIKNFGPLVNIENLEIKQFTFLIGESASGKSTLLKVVAMMRYLHKMANIRSYLKHSKISKSPFRLRLSTMMARQGMEKMFDKKSLIVYRVDIGDGQAYEIRIENGKLYAPIIPKDNLMFRKVSFVSENRNIIPSWTQKAWKNKGATLGFYFHETNDDFGNASEGDKTVALDHLGMSLIITHPKGKPTRYQIVPTDNRHEPIELTEASSGVQTSAPMTLIVDYFAKDFSFKDAFNRSVMSYLYETDNLNSFRAVNEPAELLKTVDIHIEEPELSLFPDAQCKLIENAILTSSQANPDRDVSIMIATHSPYILNYLNIILNQKSEGRAKLHPEELAVYRIFEGKTQNLMVQNENGDNIIDTYDLDLHSIK